MGLSLGYQFMSIRLSAWLSTSCEKLAVSVHKLQRSQLSMQYVHRSLSSFSIAIECRHAPCVSALRSSPPTPPEAPALAAKKSPQQRTYRWIHSPSVFSCCQ